MLKILSDKKEIDEWVKETDAYWERDLLNELKGAGKASGVRKIICEVIKRGDEALFEYSKIFDGVVLTRETIKVDASEIADALKQEAQQNPKFMAALKKAIQNIRRYHEKQKEKGYAYASSGAKVGLRTLPLDRVGVYVPGGRATYPSSVLMNVIPAQVAKVKEIVLISPPIKNSDPVKVSPQVLAAAGLLGIKEIYKVGGAHGIAALAHGTKRIPRVDKIVGPGNEYVTLAKKLIFGMAGIDKLAGPSEVLILADDSAKPDFVAAELLAQAEHDPAARAVLVTPSQKLAEAVCVAIDNQVQVIEETRREIIKKVFKGKLKENTGGGIAIAVKNMQEAIAISCRIGPEHLVIMAKNAEALSKQITNAGAIFIGAYSPVALGDYYAGPNHVLPTGGTARFSSPLGVWDFVKRQSVINYSKKALQKVSSTVEDLAVGEGLVAHARSVKLRS